MHDALVQDLFGGQFHVQLGKWGFVRGYYLTETGCAWRTWSLEVVSQQHQWFPKRRVCVRVKRAGGQPPAKSKSEISHSHIPHAIYYINAGSGEGGGLVSSQVGGVWNVLKSKIHSALR
jgi:hypothetical protein